MTKKRHLRDLYQIGVPVKLEDGSGEPVEVYLRKLTPLEVETVLRKANAKRATYIAALRDTESPEYREVYSANIERLANRDECLDVVLNEKTVNRYFALEAELAAEDEWSENEYLQGLRDAWAELEQDQESPDYERVRGELVRFNGLVGETFESERTRMKAEYDGVPDEEVSALTLKELLKTRADNAWLTELRLSEIWLATRDPEDHQKRYFQDRDEVNELAGPVLNQLITAYADLMVPASEGKDSERTQDSSSSSAQPSKEEASLAYGLVDVTP